VTASGETTASARSRAVNTARITPPSGLVSACGCRSASADTGWPSDRPIPGSR